DALHELFARHGGERTEMRVPGAGNDRIDLADALEHPRNRFGIGEINPHLAGGAAGLDELVMRQAGGGCLPNGSFPADEKNPHYELPCGSLRFLSLAKTEFASYSAS